MQLDCKINLKVSTQWYWVLDFETKDVRLQCFPGGIVTFDIGFWSNYGKPYVYYFNITNQVLVQLILARRSMLQLNDQSRMPIN